MLAEAQVVSEAGGPFLWQQIEVDDNLRDDEALIEMKATGICHTDLNFRHEKTLPGLFPGVLGHEGAGVVLKIGSNVTNAQVGDHVVITYTSCGDCKYCLKKQTSFCTKWEIDNFGVGRRDGSKAYSRGGKCLTSHFFGQSSFAKCAVVMGRSLVVIPKELPLEIMAPLGCGMMTGSGAMLNIVKPATRDTVVIVGAGNVGLAALMAIKISGAKPERVICVDVMPERLESARKYGATHTLNSRENPDLAKELMALTVDLGVDASIDTTGRPAVLKELLDAAARGGVVVSVGVGPLTAEVSTNIFDTVNSGRSYTGCCMGNCYPQEFILMLISEWKKGNFPFDELITTYNAKEIENAATDAISGKTIKPVLVW